MVKKVLNISTVIRILKILNLDAYIFEKRVHIENTLMKHFDVLIDRRWWIIKKLIKFEKKVKNTVDEEFDSDHVCNEKNLRTKIKPYDVKSNTSFDNNKIPKEGFQCIWLSVILISSVFRTGNNYCPQVYLEECKYVAKEKKVRKYIIDDIEISILSPEENSDENFFKILIQ